MWRDRLADIYRAAHLTVASEPDKMLAVILVAAAILLAMSKKEPERETHAAKWRIICLYACVFAVIVLTPLIRPAAAVFADGNIRESVLYALFPGALIAAVCGVYMYRPLKGMLPGLSKRIYAILAAVVMLLAASVPYTLSLPEMSVGAHKEPREIRELMELIEANAAPDSTCGIMLPKEAADRLAMYERGYKLYTEEEHIPTTFYVDDAEKASYYVEPAKAYECSLIVVPIAQNNEGYLIDLYKLEYLGATEGYVIYGTSL